MTKHNGKARASGAKVGQALMATHKKGYLGSGTGGDRKRHVTETHGGAAPVMASVLERNDLEELMAMATLADRDFAAERTQVIVVSTGSVNDLDEQRAAEEREEAEARHRHRLKLPRRPHWDETTTPEQLDAQERTAFLDWRRQLADIEDEERLVLTPFEKNLEVWRQLWRVLERSDIVIQVVDARDPLLYRCEDLEAYAHELHSSKASLLLLNKADLLPLSVRRRWAAFFDKVGIDYLFWSAAAVMAEHASLKAEAAELGLDWHDLRETQQRQRHLARIAQHAAATAAAERGDAAAVTEPDAVDAPEGLYDRTRILDDDELLRELEQRAAAAVAAAGPNDPRAADASRRFMVGLVGYPNVGKSSTINALFGAKKTAVAPTPGKTKHFQTLIVGPTLCLCDCPGLVMPKFARSKAEMVVAGVIPIDRLTEMRQPIDIMATRVGRAQIEEVYGLRLPPPPGHIPRNAPPTAADVLRALAMLRGWTVGSGLPDEHRTGRQLLRDFTSGKLLHCTLPPGSAPSAFVPLVHDPLTLLPLAAPRPLAPILELKPPAGVQPAASRGAAAPGQKDSSLQQGSGLKAGAHQQGQEGEQGAEGTEQAGEQSGVQGAEASGQGNGHVAGEGAAGEGDQDDEATDSEWEDEDGGEEAAEGRHGEAVQHGAHAAPGPPVDSLPLHLGQLDDADLDLLMGSLGEGVLPGGAAGAAAAAKQAQAQARRASHKFHKKAARTKGNRGEIRAEGLYDGAAMTTGKKGGLVRMTGY